MNEKEKSIVVENFTSEKTKQLYKGDEYNGFMKLPLFVIYKNVKDFGEKYVVRLWIINRRYKRTIPTKYCVVRDTLEEARKAIPLNLNRFQGEVNKDPFIETWL